MGGRRFCSDLRFAKREAGRTAKDMNLDRHSSSLPAKASCPARLRKIRRTLSGGRQVRSAISAREYPCRLRCRSARCSGGQRARMRSQSAAAFRRIRQVAAAARPVGLLVLADAINQAMARGHEQKAAEMVRAVKAPAGLAKATQHIGPDRLDDVGRIEGGAIHGRELPADRLAQIRLEGAKDLFRGRVVAVSQLSKQVIQGIVHDLPPREMIGRHRQTTAGVALRHRAGAPQLAAGDFASRNYRRPGNKPGPQPCLAVAAAQALAHAIQLLEEALHASFHGRKAKRAQDA